MQGLVAGGSDEMRRLHDTVSAAAVAVDDVSLPHPPVGDGPTESVIRAPLLGYFHRGASAGGRPFVGAGDRLAAGVTIGTITVLGLPSDVVTDAAVEIVSFLIEDGAPVEYGQPLARVRPLLGPVQGEAR